jgi:hypothetical protein
MSAGRLENVNLELESGQNGCSLNEVSAGTVRNVRKEDDSGQNGFSL